MAARALCPDYSHSELGLAVLCSSDSGGVAWLAGLTQLRTLHLNVLLCTGRLRSTHGSCRICTLMSFASIADSWQTVLAPQSMGSQRLSRAHKRHLSGAQCRRPLQ